METLERNMLKEREVAKPMNGIPKIDDIVGRVVDQIGTYGNLNNKEHVVALIDEVRQNFNQNSVRITKTEMLNFVMSVGDVYKLWKMLYDL